MERYLGLVDDPYRRAVVRRLADEDSLSVDELVRDAAPDDTSPDTARVSLYHCHLPKLDSANVIEWDRDRMTVRPGRSFESVERLLGAVAAAKRSTIPQ